MNVLDLASKIVTVLDCGIEDLLEVTEGQLATSSRPLRPDLLQALPELLSLDGCATSASAAYGAQI